MVALAILALLVFGPEGLPGIIKTVMKTVHAVKSAARDFQTEVRTALDDEIVEKERRRRRIVQTENALVMPPEATETVDPSPPLAVGIAEEVAPQPEDATAIDELTPEVPLELKESELEETSTVIQVANQENPVDEGLTEEPVPDDEHQIANHQTVIEEAASVPVYDDDGPGLPMVKRT